MMIITKIPKDNSSETGKNKPGIAVFIIVAIIMLTIIGLLIGNVVKKDNDETTLSTTEETTTEDSVNVDVSIATETDETTTEDTVTVIQLEEPTTEPLTTQKLINIEQNTEKIAEPVTQAPVTTPAPTTIPTPTPTKSPEPTKEAIYEIIEDGNDNANPYDCGVERHNCHAKEAHDFIVYLEEKGCPHCGEHICKSFYTVDQWGQASYDQTKCPKYTKEKDPLYYCQDCGRKVGNGYNNTCLMFTVDINCPECGEAVEGRTCHSH